MNMLAQADFTLPGTPSQWLVAIAGILITMIVGRFIAAFKAGAGLIDAGKAVLFGTNGPKPPVALILGFLALSLCSAGAQTNQIPDMMPSGLNFNTVTVQAYTGWQYQGNNGQSTALIGASIDIGSFQAGKLGQIDYGLGTAVTIGASGSAVQTMSIRAELIKNLTAAQIKAFAGAGRDFSGQGYYGCFGTELNYNLFKGNNWCSYVGTGIEFQTRGNQLDYLTCIRTGIAF